MTATISSVLTRDQLIRLASMPNGVLLSSTSPSLKIAKELCLDGFLKSEDVTFGRSYDSTKFYRFFYYEGVQLEFNFERESCHV